ncbi:HAMP domain-containing histidine kinase [Alteromonadaceae bacterium M269]|nr:HAMP domain-containing histidine kinase [Alteromonadaceae bacterium M269]
MLLKLIGFVEKYSMSLKHHLFILVAVLVVLLSSVQLYFAYQLKLQMTNEVEQRSQELSRKAIDTLLHRIKLVGVNGRPDSPVIVNSERKIIVREDNVNGIAGVIEINEEDDLQKVLKMKHGKVSVDLTKTQPVQVSELYKQIEVIADSIEIDSIDDMTFVVNPGSGSQGVQVMHLAEQGSLLDKFYNELLFVVAAISAIGLILAYFIAHHTSRPFHRLSVGFSKVEKGDFGSEVDVSGVIEVRDTLKGFNYMSHQLKRLQESDKKMQAQEHLAELGEVARGLAHSLRNPINTLGLALEQIGMKETTHEQREQLALRGRQKINAMDNTIKALLNLTATGVQRDASISLRDIIDDVCLECSMVNETAFDVHVAPDLRLEGDLSEVRAVIHTLVVNAAEASEPQQKVNIHAEQQNEFLKITVADIGKGISPQIQANLFKPHITDKAEGAGMGLYIARRLARLYYAGNIELVANEPKGTKAILKLRCNQTSGDAA